jgi:hypothetical protein
MPARPNSRRELARDQVLARERIDNEELEELH